MPVCPNYGEACWAMSGLCWARVGPMLGHVEPKFSNLADLRPLKKKKRGKTLDSTSPGVILRHLLELTPVEQ